MNQENILRGGYLLKKALSSAEKLEELINIRENLDKIFGVGEAPPPPALADNIYERTVEAAMSGGSALKDLISQSDKTQPWDLIGRADIANKEIKVLGDMLKASERESSNAAKLLKNYHLTDFPGNSVHSFIRDKIPGPSWAAYAAGGGLAAAGATALIMHSLNKVREKKETERQEQMMLEAAEQV